MQDRYRHLDENLLQRTAGPYTRVKRRNTRYEQMFSALAPLTDNEKLSVTIAVHPLRSDE